MTRGAAGLGLVVVDGDGKPGDDPGLGRPASARGGGDGGDDVGLDRLGRGHPEHGPIRDCSGNAQQAGTEGRDEDGHGVGRCDGPAAGVGGPVVAVEVDVLAGEEGGEDPDVLLGVPAGTVVVVAVDAFDERAVRRPDPEGESRATHGIGDRRRPVRLEERVARVGLQHRGAQLDAGRLAPGHGHRDQRVAGDDAGVPERA